MTLQYFEALKRIGDGPSTKYIFPLELTSMVQKFMTGEKKWSRVISPRCQRSTIRASRVREALFLDTRHGNPRMQILPATFLDLNALMKLERACFGADAWPLLDLIAVLTLANVVRLKAVERAT